MRRGTNVLSSDLAQIQARVATWRSGNNGKRRQIPSWVWTEAVQLARVHGVHPVSQALRLRYDKVKKLCDSASLPSTSSQARFVEVTASSSSPAGDAQGEVTIEVTNGRGHRMTIRAADSLDMAGLVASFCAGDAS